VSEPGDQDPGESSVSRTTPLLPLNPEDGGRRTGQAGDADATAGGKASVVKQHPVTGRQPRMERPAPRQTQRDSSSGSGAGERRFPPGTMLAGRYRIVHMLGRGGMGEVYCADDLHVGQRVALKLLPEKYEQDPARLERLRSEVRLARSVTHAHVCRVYDIGEAEGRRFLSMEYIEGEDLDALLRRIGRLPTDRVTEIGAQLCQGLAAIHDSGILHRDLKPANVMLDTRGRVRIADFGLASVAERVAEQDALQGTPAYMAPEQIAAQQVSIQSDLYALGLILYRLLTGKSATELYRMRGPSAPPPPSALVDGIPPAVDAMVTRCLAPDPRMRPASARAVAAALTGAASGQAAALVVAVASIALDRAALATQHGGEAAARVMQAHAQMLDELCRQHAGTPWREDRKARAVSAVPDVPAADAEVALFTHPGDAVHHALAYQGAVQALAQREDIALPIGVGIQIGVRPRVASSEPGTAPPLDTEIDMATRDRAVRLCKLARPGQILLTRSVFDLARQDALSGHGKIQWLAHGSYEVAGMAEPVEVCEVGAEGVAPLAPPADSELARRRRVQDVIAGWRPAPGMELPEVHARPHWRMEKKLGEGGFGEVWLAEHAKTHERRVFKFCYDAEKLRALQREITLFRLLKETLGDRRDIVRILDWSFDRAPYFIESEYTSGGNLTEWSAAQGGLNAVALETRLEIVAQVATALAAAHSVGVLHKDVKPANVLMTGSADGHAHAQLGDFGIGAITEKERLAEAGITAMGLTVDARTNLAAMPHGTRLYMAPELLEGKPATMQADIYALGVLLYQIVAGDITRALAPGWERDIEDELVRADIAAAVDRDPERRLSSAAQLAERLATLDERRQTLAETRQELAERERERQAAEQAQAALARARRRRKVAAVAVAVLALFASTVTLQSLRLAQKAREAECNLRTAELERRTAEQVSGFLVELFEEADPSTAKGRDVTAREILDRGKTKIDALTDQPEVQATLMHVMGVVYSNIGLFKDSAALLEGAVQKRRQLHGDEHRAVADSLYALARTLKRQHEFLPAERAAREALALHRKVLGSEHLATADTMELLADVLAELGKSGEAEPLYQQVLAMRRRLLGLEHAKVAQTLRQIGLLRMKADQEHEAMRWYRESLDMYRRLPGDHALDIAEALYYLGLSHASVSDYSAAESLFLESLDINERVLGDEHPRVYHTKGQLARVYQRTGKYAIAETMWNEVLEFYRASLGEESVGTAAVLSDLAFLARAKGDCARASALSEQSFSLFQRAFKSDHDLIATSLYHRAYLLASWGDHAAAESHYRRALDMYRRLHGDAAPLLAMLMGSLAEQYLARGHLEEAEDLLANATEILRQAAPLEEPWLVPYLESVQSLHVARSGDPESAEQMVLRSYDSMVEKHGAYRIYTKLAAERIVRFYESHERPEQAARYRSLPMDPLCAGSFPARGETSRSTR
jgi:serine/threonine protein kinase